MPVQACCAGERCAGQKSPPQPGHCVSDARNSCTYNDFHEKHARAFALRAPRRSRATLRCEATASAVHGRCRVPVPLHDRRELALRCATPPPTRGLVTKRAQRHPEIAAWRRACVRLRRRMLLAVGMFASATRQREEVFAAARVARLADPQQRPATRVTHILKHREQRERLSVHCLGLPCEHECRAATIETYGYMQPPCTRQAATSTR